MDARCFQNAGQIYYGDVDQKEDGACKRHGYGLQIVTASTIAGDSVIWGRYKGAWRHDQMAGAGCYKWSDGSAYEGSFMDGVPHGYGKLTWPEGSVYDGDWNQGEMTGQGTFFNAFNGITRMGFFFRGCLREQDGSWDDVVKLREQFRTDRLRIGWGGPAARKSIPISHCSPSNAMSHVADVLREPPFLIPLVISEEAFDPEAVAETDPLRCLAMGDHGCTPETTVHLAHVAAEKQRKRDHQQIFRDAICQALITYRLFALVFGKVEGCTSLGDLSPSWGLNHFFGKFSLPPDLFDLRHWHGSGASEFFLPLEKRGRNCPEMSSPDKVHPPLLAPPMVYLLHFAVVALQRLRKGADEEEIRTYVSRLFAELVPLHRLAIVVISSG